MCKVLHFVHVHVCMHSTHQRKGSTTFGHCSFCNQFKYEDELYNCGLPKCPKCIIMNINFWMCFSQTSGWGVKCTSPANQQGHTTCVKTWICISKFTSTVRIYSTWEPHSSCCTTVLWSTPPLILILRLNYSWHLYCLNVITDSVG